MSEPTPLLARIDADLARRAEAYLSSAPAAGINAHRLVADLIALIPEPCAHEAWEVNGGARRCADCRALIPTPPTDDEQEDLDYAIRSALSPLQIDYKPWYA